MLTRRATFTLFFRIERRPHWNLLSTPATRRNRIRKSSNSLCPHCRACSFLTGSLSFAQNVWWSKLAAYCLALSGCDRPPRLHTSAFKPLNPQCQNCQSHADPASGGVLQGRQSMLGFITTGTSVEVADVESDDIFAPQPDPGTNCQRASNAAWQISLVSFLHSHHEDDQHLSPVSECFVFGKVGHAARIPDCTQLKTLSPAGPHLDNGITEPCRFPHLSALQPPHPPFVFFAGTVYPSNFKGPHIATELTRLAFSELHAACVPRAPMKGRILSLWRRGHPSQAGFRCVIHRFSACLFSKIGRVPIL